MEYITIEAERTGYTPKQCGETMTVGELVELVESLSGYDDDVPVYLSHDNGYTYGAINEHNISCMTVAVED